MTFGYTLGVILHSVDVYWVEYQRRTWQESTFEGPNTRHFAIHTYRYIVNCARLVYGKINIEHFLHGDINTR